MKDEHLQEIVIGALLHDIGKVVQRSDEKPQRFRHQEFGFEWFQRLPKIVKDYLGDVGDFILRHHLLRRHDPKFNELDASVTGRGDLLLVCEADNLSAGERKEDQDEDLGDYAFDLSLPLYSVLNKISLNGKKSREYRAYKPMELKQIVPFPLPSITLTPQNYKDLLKEFENGLTNLPSDPIQHLLNLLERFFSFVPSETAYKQDDPSTYPDISLYDHLKITAAIASCLFRFFQAEGRSPGQLSQDEICDRSKPRYLLVGGDFSGVQDFIYTVSYRAALKGLRARSFYLELLLEHFAREVLRVLDLSRANLILCGGGNFYLLAPNTEGVKEKLKKRKEEFNRFLLQEHEGKLFLALRWVELNGNSFLGKATDGFPSVSEAWQKLKDLLDEEKAHKFHELLKPTFFVPAEKTGSPCGVCQKVTDKIKMETDPETGEEYGICSTCYSFQQLGQRLPRAKFIGTSSVRAPDSLQIEGSFYYLEETPKDNWETCYSLNDFFMDAIPLWVGNYPQKGRDFSDVVKEAIGLKALGTFRADVDNLGTVFSQGLPKPFRTLSRMAVLSRMLALFFKRYINQIASGEIPQHLAFEHTARGRKPREMVVVYSGGDDLFVTGAWSDVAEFAFELRRTFRQFVGENPALTLSGGMVITPPKFPIYRIAFMAGIAEEEAKSHKAEGKEKDSACLFGQVLFWDEWEEAIERVLNPLLQIGEFGQDHFRPAFPRGLIYKILDLARMAKEDAGQRHPYMVLPLLAYVLSRSRPDSRYMDAWEDFVSGAVSLDLEEGLHWLQMSRGVLRWLDYMTRGGDLQ